MPPPAVRSFFFACLFGIAVAASAPIVAAKAPERVVSLNLCTDQLVLLLADRNQIAALSHLADDPDLSALHTQTTGLKLIQGTAEEVLPLKPDIVLAGLYTARPTVALLKARGIAVQQIGLADDFDAIRRHVRQVAGLLGQTARGEALIAAMDAKLTAAAAPSGQPGPRILNLTSGAFTAGSGTLFDAMVRAAGMRNYAGEKGLRGYGYMALETIGADPPDLMVGLPRLEGYPSLAGQLLRHPLLAAAVPPGRRPVLPTHYWTCGGPFTADAVTLLAGLRDRIGRGDEALQ